MNTIDRRTFLAGTVAVAVASGLGAGSTSAQSKTSAVPTRIAIDKQELEDLRTRLRTARWPVEVDPDEWERGVPQGYLRRVTGYWADEFDWDAVEARLNRYEQVEFTHKGQVLHAFHVRSNDPEAMPVVLLHGWPSSGIEYLKAIEPLTNPAEGQAFHLVIPTQPGFGLSPAPTARGWTPNDTAEAVALLMQELGYERYGVHGSDMGADVAGRLDRVSEGRVIGVHMAVDTDSIVAVASFMSMDPTSNPNLSEEQKARVQEMFAALPDRMGYIAIQSTRPKTIGYALNDSPIGQLAWILEKFEAWTAADKSLEEAVDLDQFLTNASFYWFGGGGAASANAIYESLKAMGWDPPTGTPHGASAFAADDLARPLFDPEHQLAFWAEHEAGGHFPAMEEPELLAADLRAFFSGLG